MAREVMLQKYASVVSSRYGTIKSIDVDRLNGILDDIAWSSLGVNGDFYVPGQGLVLGRIPFAGANPAQRDKALLVKLVGGPVRADNAQLVQIPRAWCSDAVLSRFAGNIESCFEIVNEQSHSDNVKYALTNLKDSAIAAIREKRTGSIERVTSIYIRLGEEFLRELQVRGTSFTLDEALIESRSLFEGWTDVVWIHSHFEDLLTMSLQSGDRDIVDVVLQIPASLLAESIKCGDLYVFNTFRSYPLAFYRQLSHATDDAYRRYLISRSHQYLSEICNYVLMARLRTNDPRSPGPKRLVEFAIGVLLTFQDLLVLALYSGDLESFRAFHLTALMLLPWTGDFDGPPSTASLIAWLDQPISPEKRDEIQRELQFRQERENQLLHFNARKSEMMFGIASLAFERLMKQSADAGLREIYRVASDALPISILELSSLFARCYDTKVENFWGWMGWHIPKEEFGAFDSFGPLLRVFAFELLRRVESKDAAAIRSLQYSDRTAVRLLTSLVGLRRTLDELVERARDLGYSLPEPGSEKMLALYGLLDQLEQAVRDEEEDQAIASTPSDIMIGRFGDGVLQGFKDEASVRQIIQSNLTTVDVVIDPTDEIDEGNKRFGHQQLVDKEMLLREPDRAFEALGIQFGASIGRGENDFLLRQILEAVPAYGDVAESDVGGVVDQAVSELGTAAGSRFVLIVTDSFTVLEYWRVQGRLREPKVGRGAEQRVAALEGYYGNSKIPVFNVYGSRFSRRILLLDVATFARLTQYKPSANDGQGTQAGHFFVRMRDLNKDDQLRQDVLDGHRAQLSGQNRSGEVSSTCGSCRSVRTVLTGDQ